ncbi:hypothetical protein [Neorhizobium tomejilense]|uniref:hypothetical protein n=1 Tax=Neorhizobium tomejilense TaxID=2093828 RepID=UPI000CF84B86|nr:hypothetical protein [Neorhizobium tomejilense]
MENIKFISISGHATEIANHAHTAYWRGESQGKAAADYHRREIESSLRQMAAILGFRVEPLETIEHQEAAE